MASKAHRIQSYTFKKDEDLFFDANIWLYLYGPQYLPSDWRTGIYSSALANILAAKSRICIDALVLSEFINSFARYRYNTHPAAGRPAEFKEYRTSPLFKPVAKDIAMTCRRILGHTQRVECGFASLDVTALITEYENGKHDFNDQVLADLCKNNGFKFVTHDKDFKKYDVTKITANRQLLR